MVGDYGRLIDARKAAWRRLRHAISYGPQAEYEVASRLHDDLERQRIAYLRDLLSKLPFRWHVEHAYVQRETATHGGADHIVVDEEVRVGRLVRHAGDALSRARAKFWGLHPVWDADRIPSSQKDIEIAERVVVATT